jgi:putative hydrolase of HD superfamily
MKKQASKLSSFLYEIGTLRKIARSHRQTLGEDDLSDNIASHSYRVTVIAWFLAKMEKADPYKPIMMALFHDTAEIRSGDHNWVHKKYVKIFEDEIRDEQIAPLPFGSDLMGILNEYEHRGNKEATEWLKGKRDSKRYFTKTAQKLVKDICDELPGDWWKDIWTNKNR